MKIIRISCVLFFVAVGLGCSQNPGKLGHFPARVGTPNGSAGPKTTTEVSKIGKSLVGLSQDDVSKQLGKPTDTKQRKHHEPIWGPQEDLSSVIKPGTTYIEWSYRFDTTTLLVWFAGEGDPSDWPVIRTGTHKEGVVYESSPPTENR